MSWAAALRVNACRARWAAAASPPVPCQRCRQQQALKAVDPSPALPMRCSPLIPAPPCQCAQPINPSPALPMRCIPYNPSPTPSMRCRVIGVCYFGVAIGKPAEKKTRACAVQCWAGEGEGGAVSGWSPVFF